MEGGGGEDGGGGKKSGVHLAAYFYMPTPQWRLVFLVDLGQEAMTFKGETAVSNRKRVKIRQTLAHANIISPFDGPTPRAKANQ